MNSLFWLRICCEMASRIGSSRSGRLHSITQTGMPLTNNTMSGRQVSVLPVRSTSNSSVTWNALRSGCAQSMYWSGKLRVSPSTVCDKDFPRRSRSYTFSLVRTKPSIGISSTASIAVRMFPSENNHSWPLNMIRFSSFSFDARMSVSITREARPPRRSSASAGVRYVQPRFWSS